MYSIVKRLYEKGIERQCADISSDPGYIGELISGLVGPARTATLIWQDDEHRRPIIPQLEHAQLVLMRVDMMKFCGVEREKGGAGYEQEWSVQIIGY